MMTTLTIEELALSIKTGKTPSTSDKLNFEDGDYNWFTPGDFKTPKFLKESKRKITDYAAKSNAVIYQPDTVLITCIGDIGNAGIIKKESSANQQITGIVVNTDIIHPEFFLYWVKANKKRIQDEANQAVVPIINNKGLKRIKVTFPSDLPTQNKIVALLDRASALVQKRANSIAVLDELLRAQFLEMFGDPVLNPKGWEMMPIFKVIKEMKGGWSIGGEYRSLKENEIGVLKISAVTSGYFRENEFKAISKDKINRKLVFPKKGDLLFSRANTKEMVGSSCLMPKDYDYLFLPDKLWKLIPDEELISTFFLKPVLSNKGIRKEISKLATGTGGSMKNISKAKLNKMEIPVPPIELQNQFETIYHKIQAQKETLTQSKTELENLYNGLLQRAFKGEIDIAEADKKIEAIKKDVKKKEFIMPDLKIEKTEKKDISKIDLAAYLD